MKPIKTALLALPLLAAGCNRDSGTAKIRPLEAGSVRVEDAFWGPRYEKWEHVTVGDMLNKFEVTTRRISRAASTLSKISTS